MPKTNSKELMDAIYDIVRLIPKGKVTTYGAIAQAIGLKSGARWVGYVMNMAHADPSIPAHRVVNRKGLLTGRHHFDPADSMQNRLESEGIKIIDHQIQEFTNHFWDPSTQL